jgi:hypothetical protein
MKHCQVCNYETYLTFVDKDKESCYECCSDVETMCLNDLINDKDDYKYIFCKKCCILFRYNPADIHHNLEEYGKFYYIEVIDRYYIFTTGFNGCPCFLETDKLIEFINKKFISFNWISQKTKEECCVCFCETTHTTQCNHILCVDCNKKIDICPLCRKEQRYRENKQVDDLEVDDGYDGGEFGEDY